MKIEVKWSSGSKRELRCFIMLTHGLSHKPSTLGVGGGLKLDFYDCFFLFVLYVYTIALSYPIHETDCVSSAIVGSWLINIEVCK